MVTTQISRTADVSNFFPPFFSNLGPKVYSYKHLNFFVNAFLIWVLGEDEINKICLSDDPLRCYSEIQKALKDLGIIQVSISF